MQRIWTPEMLIACAVPLGDIGRIRCGGLGAVQWGRGEQLPRYGLGGKRGLMHCLRCGECTGR